MLRTEQCIFTSYIKFIKSHIMQKHIDTAQVVGCNINLLSIKSITNSILAKNLLSLQKQWAWTTCRIIYFIDFCFSYSSKACEQFGHICRSKEFSTRFSGIWRIHGHKVLIRIAKGINGMVFDISKIHFTYAVQQFYKLFITFCNARTQFIAVDIIIIK